MGYSLNVSTLEQSRVSVADDSKRRETHVVKGPVSSCPVAKQHAELLPLELAGLPGHALDGDLEGERVELDRACKLLRLEKLL